MYDNKMKEYRLIRSRIEEIVEEESMRMHRCYYSSDNRESICRFLANNRLDSYFNNYSVVVLNKNIGICMLSLRTWLNLEPNSFWY